MDRETDERVVFRQFGKAVVRNSADQKNRTIWVTAAREEVDRYGTVVKPSGFKDSLDAYMEGNPVFAYSHNYWIPSVGHVVEYEFKDHMKELRMKPKFDEDDFSELLWKKYALWESMRAVSIGWIDLLSSDEAADKVFEDQTGKTYLEGEFIELSAVLLGANRSALANSFTGPFMLPMVNIEGANMSEEALEQLKAQLAKLEQDVGKGLAEKIVALEQSYKKLAQDVEVALFRAVVPYQDWPIYDDRERAWDGDAAEKRWRAYCGWDGEKEGFDFPKYKKGFILHNPEEPEEFSSYKLLIVDVIDGKPYATWGSIKAIGGALEGARKKLIEFDEGDTEKAKQQMTKYYRKAAEKFDDDSIVAPWEKKDLDEGALEDLREATRLLREAEKQYGVDGFSPEGETLLEQVMAKLRERKYMELLRRWVVAFGAGEESLAQFQRQMKTAKEEN